MYPTSYVVRRAPSAAGRCRLAVPHPYYRSMHYGSPSLLFGPMASRQTSHPIFGPGRGRDVFDHFDEFVNRSLDGFLPSSLGHTDQRMRGPTDFVWQPRFDVREVEGAYQLRGELPGVEAKDLEVEFTNANTLVIRGQTENERTEGAARQEEAQDVVEKHDGQNVATTATEHANHIQSTQEQTIDDTASIGSESSYVRPTVEDEVEANRDRSMGTEATADANTIDTAGTTTGQAAVKQIGSQQARYWLSERSTGSFSRTFEFPGRIDADGVTASLKNGILDVNVPKAKAPEAKKIIIK